MLLPGTLFWGALVGIVGDSAATRVFSHVLCALTPRPGNCSTPLHPFSSTRFALTTPRPGIRAVPFPGKPFLIPRVWGQGPSSTLPENILLPLPDPLPRSSHCAALQAPQFSQTQAVGHLPEAPPPTTITLGIDSSTHECERATSIRTPP